MKDRWLFKAKRVDNGEWIIGNYDESNDNSYINYEEPIEIGGKSLKILRSKQVIQESVAPSVEGRRDKKGTLIFENDILRIDSVGIVALRWQAEYGKCVCEVPDGLVDHLEYWGQFEKHYEVIGNLFDHPELLEDNK